MLLQPKRSRACGRFARIRCTFSGADDISLLNSSVVVPDFIAGHQRITNVHLLALARRHAGRLATFDRSIPLRAVRGAGAEHLELLGS